MNLDAFSHGQIKSKMWLCENLEPFVKPNANAAILGCWYNTLAFMLLIRNQVSFNKIFGVDMDNQAVKLADHVCNLWVLDGKIVENIVADVNQYQYKNINLVINCSSEHIIGKEWFDNIPSGTLVCIQSSNVTNTNWPWCIKTPSNCLDDFLQKYPLQQTNFKGILPITYPTWGYERYMVIGVK